MAVDQYLNIDWMNANSDITKNRLIGVQIVNIADEKIYQFDSWHDTYFICKSIEKNVRNRFDNITVNISDLSKFNFHQQSAAMVERIEDLFEISLSQYGINKKEYNYIIENGISFIHLNKDTIEMIKSFIRKEDMSQYRNCKTNNIAAMFTREMTQNTGRLIIDLMNDIYDINGNIENIHRKGIWFAFYMSNIYRKSGRSHVSYEICMRDDECLSIKDDLYKPYLTHFAAVCVDMGKLDEGEERLNRAIMKDGIADDYICNVREGFSRWLRRHIIWYPALAGGYRFS